MGVYIDRHAVTELDATVRYRLQLEAYHGIRDRTGVLSLGHWAEDGSIYCLLEAPDGAAVCEHHRERGLRCDDLHPLDGISGARPLSGEGRVLVLATIQRLWHAPVEAPQ